MPNALIRRREFPYAASVTIWSHLVTIVIETSREIPVPHSRSCRGRNLSARHSDSVDRAHTTGKRHSESDASPSAGSISSLLRIRGNAARRALARRKPSARQAQNRPRSRRTSPGGDLVVRTPSIGGAENGGHFACPRLSISPRIAAPSATHVPRTPKSRSRMKPAWHRARLRSRQGARHRSCFAMSSAKP